MDRHYRFLGACCGLGAQIRACEKGPLALFPEIEMFHPSSSIYEFNLVLAKEVAKTMEGGRFPVVLGGDHSIAVGTWNGVAIKKPISLIWIDAHMDSHTPETTPSGAFHGMPLAGLMGYGEASMAKLLSNEPVILPENLILIGVRSFEEEEAALLERLKVKIYFIDEVKKRGLKTIVTEVMAKITTPYIGLSIDLDAIDPLEAPGVGSPEPNGLSSEELLFALPDFKKDSRFVAFELVEYNPERDQDYKTRELIYNILKNIL